MKKLSTFLLIVFGLYSCQESTPSYKYEKIPCVVTEVKFYSIGQRNTMQIDPEWVAKTDCGRSVTLRTQVKPGDTIWGLVVTKKNP